MNKNRCIQESIDGCSCECDDVCGEIVKLGKANVKPKVLLHSCCGPCSTAVIERLFGDYNITVFYFNPCITENDEYEKRKREQIRFIDEFNDDMDEDQKVKYMEGSYRPDESIWLKVWSLSRRVEPDALSALGKDWMRQQGLLRNTSLISLRAL